MSAVEGGWEPIAAELEKVSSRKGRETIGYFAIEGTRLHERAVRAGAEVPRAICSSDFSSKGARESTVTADLIAAGCDLRVAPDDVLAHFTAGRKTGAILGLTPMPADRSLDDLLDGLARPLVLVACDVEDPGNVGALVRTALASGADLTVAVGISDPFHPRAARVSMGSLFKALIIRAPSAVSLIDAFRGRGIKTLGALSSGEESLTEIDFGDGGCAIFVGREAFGLSARVSTSLDSRFTIPMGEGVDSFSVNAAAAIALYEANRSRSARDSSS